MTADDARKLLEEGRKKQALAQLTACVKVDAARQFTIKLLGKADGERRRKLVLGWLGPNGETLGFLLRERSSERRMWGWYGDGQWTKIDPFNPGLPLENTRI